MLERKVKAQKLLGQHKERVEMRGSLDDIELKPDEYAEYLARAYKARNIRKTEECGRADEKLACA